LKVASSAPKLTTITWQLKTVKNYLLSLCLVSVLVGGFFFDIPESRR